MNQFHENFVAAVEAFEHKFQAKPEILQGHPRTLVLSVISDINELLENLEIKIIYNDALPTGELRFGKFIAEKFRSVQIK